MEGCFRNILSLIDYSDTSLHAAKEAALIALKFDAQLQLLHVTTHDVPVSLAGVPFFDQPEKEEEVYYRKVEKLEQLKKALNRNYNISISAFENRGNFIDVIKHHVHDFSIDLVVMGNRKKSWFKEVVTDSKAMLVIKSVNCEVLCVHRGSKTDVLKKIVLPVSKSIPTKKIAIAYELARKFTARIHLVALSRQEKMVDDESTKAMVAAYRYLKDITNIPIECNTVYGKSIADAAMHYAEVIEADLILIDEGAESDLKMPLGNGNIVNHSLIPVLSVQTIHDESKKRYRA